MQIQSTFVSTQQGLTNTFGQMHVGGRNNQHPGPVFDAHNAIPRMIRTPEPFLVTGQRQYFQLMRPDKITAQCEPPGRIIIPHSLASLTGLQPRIHRPEFRPLPAAVLEDGVANGTDAGFLGFAGGPVRVVDSFKQKTIFAGFGREHSSDQLPSVCCGNRTLTSELTVTGPPHKLPFSFGTLNPKNSFVIP